MGPPERCQHAAHVINELILTAQVGLALWSFNILLAEAASATWGSRGSTLEQSPPLKSRFWKPVLLSVTSLQDYSHGLLYICLFPALVFVFVFVFLLVYYSSAFIISESRFLFLQSS